MRRVGLLMIIFWLSLSRLPITVAQTPINVFIQHNRPAQTVTIYFTNPVSGLSTPVTVTDFRSELLIYEEFKLIPNGVIYRHPGNGQVLVAQPNGQIIPHPFIPQQASGLVDVNWVISPDRNSIGWVEIHQTDTGYLSSLYMADMAGQQIIPLPPPPPSQIDPTRRARPIGITNDRQLLFYDAAYPVGTRSLTDYFLKFSDIYVASPTQISQIPGEPVCACGASLNEDGVTFVRLVQTIGGFQVDLRDLPQNRSFTIQAATPAFDQAGELYFEYPYIFYTQAQNLENNAPEAQFALMRINLFNQRQDVLLGPSAQRFRALDVMDDGQTLMVADIYGGGTYKLDLASQELSQVSESSWLGIIYQ